MSSGCGENAEPPGLLERHTRSASFLVDEEGERPRCGVFREAEAPGAAGRPAAFVPTGGPKARWLRSTIDSSLAAQVGFFSSKCGLSTAASGFPVGLLEMQDFCPALHPESESESWRRILGWWARGEGGQLRGLEVGHLTPLPDEAP